MKHSKFDKKLRFSQFLPSGVTSQYALELSMDYPKMASIIYHPTISMSSRIDECHKAHISHLAAIRSMEKYGYTVSTQRKFGSNPWEEIRVYSLTKSGLYLISNTPNAAIEQERIDSSEIQYRRNMSNQSYLSSNDEAITQRSLLYQLAKEKHTSAESENLFNEAFRNALESDELSILASEPVLAESVQTPPVLKGFPLYKAWRLSNVNALFRANEFLTVLDRRPFTEVVRSLNQEAQLYNLSSDSIEEFVKTTINSWYNNHENSFSYQHPNLTFENLTDYMRSRPTLKKFDNWYDIPAFYATAELPGFELFNPQKSDMNERGSNTVVRHSCIGVAVGHRTNYLVYHTRPKRTPWSKSLEQNSAIIAQKILDKYGAEIDFNGANRSINNAIMICPTVHQFASLFTNSSKKKIQKNNFGKQYFQPFNNVCVVPVNHSGSIQLQALMLTSPEHFERILTNTLKERDGFSILPPTNKIEDSCFQLTYNKRPVFLAYCMNLQQISWALDAYNEGRKFYVMCYPEQAKFIEHIMPNVEFL